MVATVLTSRSAGADPPANNSLAPGELALLMDSPFQLWAGVNPTIDASGRKLLRDASAGPGPYLPLAGGALTGPLTLAANPTTALEAATKDYVDTRINVDLYAWRDGSRPFTAVQTSVEPVVTMGAQQMITANWLRNHIALMLPPSQVDTGMFMRRDGSTQMDFVLTTATPAVGANGIQLTNANWVRARIAEAIGPLIEELNRGL
jgi:hypothetical protein